MPRLELPAGTSDAQVTDDDREWAKLVATWSWEYASRQARASLREARRLQRRAVHRGAGRRAQLRTTRETVRSAQALIRAGVLCGIAEMLKAGQTPLPERIARVRERCLEQHVASVPEYAIRVENWTRDLAGEGRLTRG